MSQNKKNKAYVKKLNNGFAIKAVSNKSGSESVLIITSDYLVKSNRGLNQIPSSIGCQLTAGKDLVGKTSETSSTNSNNAINTIMSHLEPHLCGLKPDIAGFHLFKNDSSLSPENMDTSIIFVANTKLAREKGITFNVPAKLVNVRKTICSDNTITNGEPVVKPVMVIVGNYVVHIKICCEIPAEPPTTTIGTQTSGACAEPVNDEDYYHAVASVKPTTTHTINSEGSQTEECYSQMLTQNMISETYPLLECDSILSTVEQQGVEQLSLRQTTEESQQIDAISCSQPIQYMSNNNSTTQTEYVGTNSIGTSTADLYERGGSDGDSEADCSSYQNLSTLVVNNSIPDIYHLENKTFKSHEYCHDSNSFETFASHYRDPKQATTTNVTVSPTNMLSSKDNMITIFKNSFNNTSNTCSFGAPEDNTCMLDESNHLNQEAMKKEHLPMTNKPMGIGLTQSISSNLPGEEGNRILSNENNLVTRKEFSTNSRSLETSASTLGSTRVSFKNILYDQSGSNGSAVRIQVGRKYNKYANKLKPNFYNFNFKGCFKKSKKCLEPKHNRYDYLVYSNKTKVIDKKVKHKPNVIVSYTKQKFVYPKFSKSVITMFPNNINNQKKKEFKDKYKSHYMCCMYTRKSIIKNTPIELERIERKSNSYHLKNNQNSYKAVFSLTKICGSETKSSIHYMEVNNPKNTSSISVTTHSDRYENEDPIEECPIRNDDNIKMNCLEEADLQLNIGGQILQKESDPKLTSQPILVKKLNRNINYSNISSSSFSLVHEPSRDQQIKESIRPEDDNDKTNIVQIFEKATFGTQTSSIHILPSSHEVQLASIDLSDNQKSAMQYPLTDTKDWSPSDYKDDISNILSFRTDSVKSKRTLKQNLSNHLSLSCPVKVNFTPSNKVSKKDNLEKEKSTNKINSYVNYLFLKFKKHNKVINT